MTTGGEVLMSNRAQNRIFTEREDLALRDKIANEVVLARWAERCGADCAANWNATVGSILGLEAKAE